MAGHWAQPPDYCWTRLKTRQAEDGRRRGPVTSRALSEYHWEPTPAGAPFTQKRRPRAPSVRRLDGEPAGTFSPHRHRLPNALPTGENALPTGENALHTPHRRKTNQIEIVPPRFVTAEKGDLAKGRARWEETKAWRQSEGVDTILSMPHPKFDLIKACYPHAFHQRTKEGKAWTEGRRR